MAIGDIVRVVDTFEFDTTYGSRAHLIHLSGNIYLMIYSGSSGYLYGDLATVEIIDGQITEPAKDTYRFVTDGCDRSKIIHIDDTTYCAVYRDGGADVAFRTFTIADNGAITEPEIATAVLGTTTQYLDIQQVYQDVHVVLYGHGAGLAYAVTWSIGVGGALGASQIDDLTIVNADIATSNLLTISPGIFAFSYSTGGYALGYAGTFKVDLDGTIHALFDSLQISDTGWQNPHIFHIANDVYGAVANGGGNNGKLVTFEISPTGAIPADIIDSYVFETGGYASGSVAQVAADVFAIAYDGPDHDGWIKTVKIASDGKITEPFLHEFEFDTDNGVTPWIWLTEDGYYAISYSGADDDGFIKTLEITSAAPSLGHTELLMGIGP